MKACWNLFSGAIILCLAAVFPGISFPDIARADEGAIQDIRVKSPLSTDDIRDSYFRDLLSLALRKTDGTDGPARVVTGMPANQSRAIAGLQAGHFDVIWTIPTEERLRDMLAVNIPLERGLLGYRVFLIRADRQDDFRKIKSLDELKALLAGQGKDWNSTKVFQANGFKVSAAGYKNLFPMLAHGRIDYFPRGLNEAWAELSAHPDMGLAVEDSILLRYPATSVFFVAKDREDLARRIETGLNKALMDGSFDKMVLEHPAHEDMLEKAGLGQRRIFDIPNPTLPEAILSGQKALWTLPGLLPDS